VAVEKIAGNMYYVEPDVAYVVLCNSSVTGGSIIAIVPFFILRAFLRVSQEPANIST
jgi:hypothetical protein